MAAQAPDLEVLDEDIGAAGKVADDSPALRGAEVDGDRALAAVAGMEIGGVYRPVAVVDEGRPPLAGFIAVEGFDLDDLGAEVSQHLTRPRAGKHAGEFQDPETSERRRTHDGMRSGRPSGANLTFGPHFAESSQPNVKFKAPLESNNYLVVL